MSTPGTNRVPAPIARATPGRDTSLPRTASPFLPAPDGGYALAHVVEWQRLPSGEVEVTLAANDVHRHGYVVARTKVLPPAEAVVFLAAIDLLTGDHRVLTALTQERDAAQARCTAVEDAAQALHAQLTASQAHRARLEIERDEAVMAHTAAYRRTAILIRLLADAGWTSTRIARAFGDNSTACARLVADALAARSLH